MTKFREWLWLMHPIIRFSRSRKYFYHPTEVMKRRDGGQTKELDFHAKIDQAELPLIIHLNQISDQYSYLVLGVFKPLLKQSQCLGFWELQRLSNQSRFGVSISPVICVVGPPGASRTRMCHVSGNLCQLRGFVAQLFAFGVRLQSQLEAWPGPWFYCDVNSLLELYMCGPTDDHLYWSNHPHRHMYFAYSTNRKGGPEEKS